MLDTDKHLDLHLRPSCCPLQSKPTPARSFKTLSIELLHHALSTPLPCRALLFAMSCLLPCSSHRDGTGHYPPLSPPSPLLFFPPGKFFFLHGLPAFPLLITEDCFFLLTPKTTRRRALLALHSHGLNDGISITSLIKQPSRVDFRNASFPAHFLLF